MEVARLFCLFVRRAVPVCNHPGAIPAPFGPSDLLNDATPNQFPVNNLKQKLRRVFRWLCLLALAGVLAAVALWRFLLPTPVTKTEIFKGVQYVSAKIENMDGTSGRMMAFEIELDAPGVEFFIRPLDPAATGEGEQYVLRWADLEVWRHELAILVNGALYRPGDWWRSYPGARVSAVESLVIDGKLSHHHKHSYLIWFDETLLPHVETNKPPPADAVRRAKWAIGVQRLLVRDGQAISAVSEDREEVMKRTFIGVDPKQRKLWLLVFDAINSYRMADIASEMGVVYGGQLDSDNGTWGIVGPGAKDVRAMTGIRGGRPIASYLGIRASPIEE